MWIKDVFKEGGILDKMDKEAVCTFFLLFAWSGDTRIMKTPGKITFDGMGLSEKQYCYKLRMTPEKFREMTKILIENEMITYEKGIITIVNFKYWQDKKVGEDNEEIKNEPKNEPKNEVQKLEVKKLRSKNKEKDPLSTSVDAEISDIVLCWNKICETPLTPLDIMACRDLTQPRINKLKTRLKNKKWAASWKEALRKVFKSSFLRGLTPRGAAFENWRADFDWFIRPDTVTRIMEGKHDDKVKTNEREAD